MRAEVHVRSPTGRWICCDRHSPEFNAELRRASLYHDIALDVHEEFYNDMEPENDLGDLTPAESQF